MSSILCIDPSASYGALVAQMAAQIGLGVRICSDSQTGFECLLGSESYKLMVVANQLKGEFCGIDLIRSARLLAGRVKMPIIFIMSEHDMTLAHDAMVAGATEVCMRSETTLLDSLIGDLSRPAPVPSLSGRVLLAEDSESQRAYVTHLCQTIGFTVDQCVSVQESLEKLRSRDYQLAVIDIVLLGAQNGLTLVRHIRRATRTVSRLPILVMSGFNDIARRVEALRLGADDYLNKPFAEEEFVWRLQRIMQDNSGSEHGRHEVEPSLIDWRKCGLSIREGQICEALIRGSSDKQIAADLDISFWTVRTHVSRIFAKLGVLNRRELMAKCLGGQ